MMSQDTQIIQVDKSSGSRSSAGRYTHFSWHVLRCVLHCFL